MQKKNQTMLAATMIVIVLLGIVAGFSLLNSQPPSSDATLNVLATFYPLYDFAKNVGRDKVSVSILVPETVDVHDFDPTPSSIASVARADVLIYNGAGLEPWVSSVVKAADNPNISLVDSSAGIQLLQVPSQFQSNNQTSDPHIWLNPVLVKKQVNNILNGLIEADPADSQYFTQNAQAYQQKLDDLNAQILAAMSNVKTRYFVTFHESFAYFAKEYDLTQIPIAGPFQEEPTANDIQNVINAIKQHHLLYVGYESLENPAVPESISSQTNATLILMNPIEGLTAEDKAAGKDYLILMQENLSNIVLALNNIGS
ncbi:MAG TPA: zinc ABC transporter substrate-binding protein [Candidatus Bathyarchaeia archaeon]|nr:zinc ABC transporter substrate-binding protein [Candidatus Bathyarchaeia archaeon]